MTNKIAPPRKQPRTGTEACPYGTSPRSAPYAESRNQDFFNRPLKGGVKGPTHSSASLRLKILPAPRAHDKEGGWKITCDPMIVSLEHTGAILLEEIIKSLDAVVKQTTFDIRNSGTFTSAQLRAIYERDKLHGSQSATFATPNIPEGPLIELAERLRPLLQKYIDPETDRIGNGLVDLMGGQPQPTVAEFARILARATSVLGSKRVVQLLFGWIQGEPLHYKATNLLSGVIIDQSLALTEGIRITSLPNSSADLPAFLPSYLLNLSRQSISSFLGGVMLSIDCKAEPALYKPSKSEELQSNMQHTWAQGKLPALSSDALCEAISLACNGCVRWKLSWRDHGELQEFNPGFSSMSYADVPDWGTATHLSQQQLEQAREIYLERHAGRKKRTRLDTAIRRWMRSKRSNASPLDQSIDLRIALEALYLESDAGEMRFRLATNGAWHLGIDFAERRDYYNTLRRAYDLASKAVHASEVNFTERERNLLATAQDACHQGILKRLKEKEAPNWNELILGGSQQEDTT